MNEGSNTESMRFMVNGGIVGFILTGSQGGD